jgi:toxin CptA
MLRLELKPSRYLAAVFGVAHAAAASVLLPMELCWCIKVIAFAGIAGSLAHTLECHARLRSRRAIFALDVDQNGALVHTRDGKCDRASILGTSYISPALTVLNLRLENRTLRRHVIIVPDNVHAEVFRRLRVWLRWRYREEC